MLRAALALGPLLAALGVVVAGCGSESESGLVGDPAAGRQVFRSADCTTCHALPDATARTLTEAFVIERVTDGKGIMPSFKSTLTEQEIADVAAYIVQGGG